MANNKLQNELKRCTICDYCKACPSQDQFLFRNSKDIYFIKDKKTGEWLCSNCHFEISGTIYDTILREDEGDDYKWLISDANFDFAEEVSLIKMAEDSSSSRPSSKSGSMSNPHGRAGNPVQKKGWNPGDPIPDPKYALEGALEAPRKAVQAVPEGGQGGSSLEPDRQPTALPEAPAAASISRQEGEGTTDER